MVGVHFLSAVRAIQTFSENIYTIQRILFEICTLLTNRILPVSYFFQRSTTKIYANSMKFNYHMIFFPSLLSFQNRHVGTLNLMWTSIIKRQFDMKLKIQFRMPNSFIGKNRQKNCTKKNDDANIYKSYRIWIIDDTLTILRHHKNRQFHCIVMMTLVQFMIMPRNHQITRKPLHAHCTISRDKHPGL